MNALGTILGSKKNVPIVVLVEVERMPVVHTRSAEALVVYLEAIGSNEVKATTDVGAQPPDVTGVLRNLGTKEDEVNHR